MTHYTISYKDMPETEAHQKALADIKDWLGEDRFLKITKGCREAVDPDGNPEILTFPQWRMAMFLSGIEGYPLKAWYKEIWPNMPIEDDSDITSV